MTKTSSLLLYCSFLTIVFSSAQSHAGIISGTTVALDGVTPEAGVQIRAFNIDANGDVGGNVRNETSKTDGSYRIDVGDRDAVQLQFFNNSIETVVERLSGRINIAGLVVVAPRGLLHPRCPSPQIIYQGCLPARRCCSCCCAAQQLPSTYTAAVATAPLVSVKKAEKIVAQEWRTWSNKSGSVKIVAKLLSVENGKARFERETGERICGLLGELSDADRQFIVGWQGSQKLAQGLR